MKNKTKKVIAITAGVLGTTYVVMRVIAKKQNKNDKYKNNPDEQNPMYKKQVVFIEDESDEMNADGKCGHLEAVGNINHIPTFYEKYVKRGMDIVFSFGGMVALAPIYAGTAIAIKLDDPGEALFHQKRIAEKNGYFTLIKFRSMSKPSDVPTHMLSDGGQSNITRVGKVIRKLSIDELPQLWSIFKGDMSIIGPRPALWNQDWLTAERSKYGANDIKPGLTGLAQISGRDALEILDKAKLDGEYAKALSKSSMYGFKMDCKIFFGTIGSVLRHDGVVEGGTGEMVKENTNDFSDYGFLKHFDIDKTRKIKVLITGANSYIGTSFEAWAQEHYPNIKVDTVDTIDDTWREKDFSEYDAVFHVAGLAHADVGHVDEATKAKYYAVNRDLAIEVAEKAKADGVKQFVFMSSMIVYGESAGYGKKKCVDEHTVSSPANFYGDSKWQADKGVRALGTEDFNVAVLRPPMIYGRGSKGNYPTLAKLAKKLPVFPNVDNERSMLHIDNLCEFLCLLMLSGESGVYFPQNSEYTKTADMVKTISHVCEKNILETKVLNPAVKMGSHVPGKIGGLVNKAFGNMVYNQKLSKYDGLEYRICDLKESITRTERISLPSKKRVAVLSSQYFWLPEEAGPTRFYAIASVLQSAGYEVDVITSSFEHHDKKQRNMAIKSPFNMVYIQAPTYKKNVSPMRVVSNQVFTSKLKEYLKRNGSRYDAVYCSLPPNDVAAIAGKYCHKNHIPFIVDVEDLWPEAMEMVVHNPILQKLVFPKFHNDAEKAYKYADAIVGTSEDYTERATQYNHRNIPGSTVYVGCDVDKFDTGVATYSDGIDKPYGEFWVTYAGSIGTSYDIRTFVLSGKELQNKYPNIKLKILGGGPLKDELEVLVKSKGINNVAFLGYVQYPEMAAYLTKSDVVLNSFVKGAPQSIVNKVGDYLSSRKPMINTLENPIFCNLVSKNNVGINIEPENVDVLVNTIIDMYENTELREKLGKNARELAEKKFDRKTSYQEIVNVVNKLF